MTNNPTIILFADLTGSVRLYESLGDIAAKSIVVELQEQLSTEVVKSKGIVHEIIGDEIMCCFDQAEHAIECAKKIHQRAEDYCRQPGASLAEQPALPDKIEMRVGIHAGPVIRDGDRLFGDTVNTGARIMSIAQARHAAQDLFLTFDQIPFIPLKSKKGRPRQQGETQIQRTRYPVVKKTTKKQKINRKNQFKIE